MSMDSTVRLLTSVSVPAGSEMPRRVRVRIHASQTGDTILWETDAARVWPDGENRWTIAMELSLERVMDGALFRDPVRFVSVWLEAGRCWTDRSVLDGTAVRQAIR